MAKGHFVYIPAMMRFTYYGMAADFEGWREFLGSLVDGMAISEIEIAIDELDRAFHYSSSEEDLANLARSSGSVELPPGPVGKHFSDIREMLRRELNVRNPSAPDGPSVDR